LNTFFTRPRLDANQPVNYSLDMGRTSDARQRLLDAGIDLIWQQSFGTVSVDAICERAKVKKGSFYHFFRSKDDLVLAALDAHWDLRRANLDRLFSPTVPTLQRLRTYFASVYARQMETRARYGHVLGCFYSAVGMECGSENPLIRRRCSEILGNYERYYESALRDAAAAGEVPVDMDVRQKARALFAFMEGVLSQARIADDMDLIRGLASSAMQFLGVEAPSPGPRRRAALPAVRRRRVADAGGRRPPRPRK
jgi:TetR/AcrR family transcriptional repressor of nem operon